MLIILGGYIGSGRRALARELALRQELHLIDLSRFDFRLITRGGGHVAKVPTTARDSYACTKAIQEFPLLSKMYANVIIEHVMHLKGPRTLLFEAARKYFDRVVFVWVESEEGPDERFALMMRNKVIRSLESGRRERQQQMEEFEPFGTPPITFIRKADSTLAAKELWELVQRSPATTAVS